MYGSAEAYRGAHKWSLELVRGERLVPERKRPSRIGGTQRQVLAIAAVHALDRE